MPRGKPKKPTYDSAELAKGRDLYATFQNWCRKDAIKNPTRAVQFENSPSKFELLKAQQEERELSGVSNGDIDGDTREIYGASI